MPSNTRRDGMDLVRNFTYFDTERVPDFTYIDNERIPPAADTSQPAPTEEVEARHEEIIVANRLYDNFGIIKVKVIQAGHDAKYRYYAGIIKGADSASQQEYILQFGKVIPDAAGRAIFDGNDVEVLRRERLRTFAQRVKSSVDYLRRHVMPRLRDTSVSDIALAAGDVETTIQFLRNAINAYGDIS